MILLVEVEPRIRDDGGVLRKPDLLLVRGDVVVVCDVAVCWEGLEPLAAVADKAHHYNDDSFNVKLSEKFLNREIRHHPLVLGARGG